MRTGSSRAASDTICRKKPRRPLPKPSSRSPSFDRLGVHPGRHSKSLLEHRTGRGAARQAQDGRHRNSNSNRGAVAEAIGDPDQAMARAAKVKAIYQVPFLAHTTIEPMNMHSPCAPGRLRCVARQPGGRPSPGGGKNRRPAVGQGSGSQSSDRRRLRPPAGGRRCHSRRPARAACRRPARHIGLMGSTDFPPVSMRRECLSVIARWLAAAFDKRSRSRHDRGRDRSRFMPPQHARRVCADWTPTAFWRSVRPSHKVFVTESFIDELAAAAKQDPVAYRRALLDKAPRATAVLVLPRTIRESAHRPTSSNVNAVIAKPGCVAETSRGCLR